MADRVSASITLGGTISPARYPELADLIAAEGLATEWDGETFELDHRTPGQPLQSSAEVLRCLRDARHWVDRQRDVAAGQADNCVLVRAGRLTYTADMLEPETRISKSHRDLMAHLVACVSLSPSVENGAAAAKRLSLEFDGMLGLDALIERAKFEAAGVHAEPTPDLDSLESAFTAYEKAAEAVGARLAALDACVSEKKTYS